LPTYLNDTATSPSLAGEEGLLSSRPQGPGAAGAGRESRNVQSAGFVNKGGSCLALCLFWPTAGSSGYARGGVRDMEMGDQQNLPPLSDGRLGRFFLGERRDVAGAEDEYEMKLSCRLFGDVLDGIAMWP